MRQLLPLRASGTARHTLILLPSRLPRRPGARAASSSNECRYAAPTRPVTKRAGRIRASLSAPRDRAPAMWRYARPRSASMSSAAAIGGSFSGSRRDSPVPSARLSSTTSSSRPAASSRAHGSIRREERPDDAGAIRGRARACRSCVSMAAAPPPRRHPQRGAGRVFGRMGRGACATAMRPRPFACWTSWRSWGLDAAEKGAEGLLRAPGWRVWRSLTDAPARLIVFGRR